MGTATYLQTTETVSTVLHTQTTVIPCFGSGAASKTTPIGAAAAAATSPSALSLESSATSTEGSTAELTTAGLPLEASATETRATSDSGISGNGSGIISSTSAVYTGPMATGGAPRLLGLEGGIDMGMADLVGLGFLLFVGAVALAV